MENTRGRHKRRGKEQAPRAIAKRAAGRTTLPIERETLHEARGLIGERARRAAPTTCDVDPRKRLCNTLPAARESKSTSNEKAARGGTHARPIVKSARWILALEN
jgi:hypothetical protein